MPRALWNRPHREALRRIIWIGASEQNLIHDAVRGLNALHRIECRTDTAISDKSPVERIWIDSVMNRKQSTTAFNKLQNPRFWD
jgi:hypothetical protein